MNWREQLRDEAVKGLSQEFADGLIELEELEEELDVIFELVPA